LFNPRAVQLHNKKVLGTRRAIIGETIHTASCFTNQKHISTGSMNLYTVGIVFRSASQLRQPLLRACAGAQFPCKNILGSRETSTKCAFSRAHNHDGIPRSINGNAISTIVATCSLQLRPLEVPGTREFDHTNIPISLKRFSMQTASCKACQVDILRSISHNCKGHIMSSSSGLVSPLFNT